MANSRSLHRAVRLALATAAAGAGVGVLHAQEAPAPAPYPVQRGLTQPMRDAAQRDNDIRGMQAWAGQAAALARAEPAAAVVRRIWTEALSFLA